MERKRLRNTNPLGDEEEQANSNEPEIKKFKSTSTGVPSFLPPSESNPAQNSTPNSDQIKAMIAQKKAHLEAMMASFKPLNKTTTTTSSSKQPPPVIPISGLNTSITIPSLPANKAATATPTLPPSSSPSSNPTVSRLLNDPDLQRKILEAKERVKINMAKANPYLPSTTSVGKSDDSTKAKGGLKVEAHPALLLDQSGKLDLKQASTLIPKPNFATVKANQRLAPATVKQEPKTLKNLDDVNDITQNPYYDPRAGNIAPQRVNRKRFKFVPKGKYEALGNQLRTQAKLEKLKEEIAESVKKAGMEAELDSSDKAIKKDPPPALEWWDIPLLINKTYDDIDAGLTKIENEDTLVTLYVQHPVPIKPPDDNGLPPPKPLILTKKEQKKLRKQRRLELQKEKQDKIRLGLLPPDQAKVKLSNLMRVLTNDAIQDPTKIEAQVRKEMQKRQETHLKANEERKLTDEQKRDKRLKKLEEDANKAIVICVYKVNDLSHPKMKFKVDTNAQQLGLTGTVIINPNFSVVVVEGGPKSIKHYKKLMLRRIDWQDTTRLGEGGSSGTSGIDGVEEPDEMMIAKKPKENKCSLIWEGEVKERGFKGFWFKTCPTDNMAREYLKKHKAEHYWDLASKYTDELGELSVSV